jgi:hypothetical protein
MPNIGSTGGAIPVGGTANQVLAKNTGTDYDTAWVANSAGSSDGFFAPSYSSGYWYDRRTGTHQVASGSVNTTATPTVSQIYYVPVYLHKSVTVSAFALCSGGAAGATSGAAVRIGSYKPDGTDGAPSTLITDYGVSTSLLTLATTLGTFSTLTLSSSSTLPKGFVWLALSFNSTSPGPMVNLIGQSGPSGPLQGWSNTSFTFANVAQQPTLFYYTATGNATASALVATVSPAANYANTGYSPNVFFRIA